jgi:hypothetical protein
MTHTARTLATLAIAAVAALAAVGSAPASGTTLPPNLQALLSSNLSACINNPTCLSYLKQAINVCKADAACYSALRDFLAANPAIYAFLRPAEWA